MKKFSTLLSLLALLSTGAGCAATGAKPSRGPALSGAEIRTAISGQTLRATGGGDEADLAFAANGTISAANPLGEKNDGRWTITPEGQLCQQFKRWGHGDKICYTVYKDGSGYQEYTGNGLLAYTLTPLTNPAPAPPTAAPLPAAGQAATAATVAAPPPVPTNPETTKNDLRYIVRETARHCPACNLAAVDLAGADLPGANLAGANLSGANLAGSNLRRANLQGANLTQANLRETDLRGANLEGANLTEADLTAAKLTGAKGLPRP